MEFRVQGYGLGSRVQGLGVYGLIPIVKGRRLPSYL